MNDRYKIHLIGNAHLDPVWLWRWQEGFAEIKATFRSALDRMNEFPDFIFTCACAAYYKWVEENDTEMFNEIYERIKEGRWVIAGGWWIQPDCNIPSGESFIRHGLYSQRYFLEKFGTMAKVGYNVDSFGHNGMLPQILKKSGMDYYVFMRPDKSENSSLPGNLFWWEGKDGSRVMTFRIPDAYCSSLESSTNPVYAVNKKLNDGISLADEKKHDFMVFYGVGNHGGGPTIASLKYLHEVIKESGEDKISLSSPNKYFTEVGSKFYDLPTYRDDLQHHASGCYSAYSPVKSYNRKSEHRLLSAEKIAATAECTLGYKYDNERLKRAWEKVMFNQFHDIMGGCSIKEAYNDALEFYGEALTVGAEILNSSLQKISWSIDTMGTEPKKRSKEKDIYIWEDDNKGTPFIVFSPLSWEVSSPVQVNRLVKMITDDMGNPVLIQKVRGPQTNGDDKWNTLFTATVPPMGYRLYWVYLTREIEYDTASQALKADDNTLENNYIRLGIEPHTGYINMFYDKINDIDIMIAKGAVPVVIDINNCDTWAHGKFEFRNETGRFSDAEVKLIENGPIRAKLRVTSRYNSSVLQQDFTIHRDKADIEVKVKLDWHEKHKMLKLAFPVNVKEPKATYEIPYGYIERPCNGKEEPGQQWVDVSGTSDEKNYGLAILNDCKYSFDVKDNEIRMTAANSSIFADHYGMRDDLCDFMDQGVQEFYYSIVPHSGDWRSANVVKKANELNVKPVCIMETYHKGPMPQRFSGIIISSENVIATVFKKAESGEGYILRCYETNGVICDADIEIPMIKRKWFAHFNPCEIKTFYISTAADAVTEKNLLEL